ncbi:MAG: hypothetical protein GXP25_16695 [Planctomycetes bacterium]|nr:hypothetical protein [Planctomycetota bacterium]
MATVKERIRFYCGHCGKRLKAEPDKVGRSSRCTKCGKPVPVPRKQLGRTQIRLYCPVCGARIRAFADRSGKGVKCTRCGENIRLAKIRGPKKPKSKGSLQRESGSKNTTHPKVKPKTDVDRKLITAPKRKTRQKLERPSPSLYVIPVPEERERPFAAAEPEKAAAPRRHLLLKVMFAVAIVLMAAAIVGFVVLRVTSPDWLNVRLMRAARDGDADAAQRLILWGADVNSKTPIPQTPLHWAAMNGHRKIVDILIDHGADINATDENGKTPLFQAVSFGHWDIAQLLIYRNANANIPDRDGFTPLYQAAYAGSQDVVELLVAAGADVNATVAVPLREDGSKIQTKLLTALDAAVMAGHKSVAEFLREHGAKARLDKR